MRTLISICRSGEDIGSIFFLNRWFAGRPYFGRASDRGITPGNLHGNFVIAKLIGAELISRIWFSSGNLIINMVAIMIGADVIASRSDDIGPVNRQGLTAWRTPVAIDLVGKNGSVHRADESSGEHADFQQLGHN